MEVLNQDAYQRILDAMDGISMIIDSQLRIMQLGVPNWGQFFEQNSSPHGQSLEFGARVVIGQPITAFIAGQEVRKAYANMFHSVFMGRHPVFHLDYRCDAPTIRRNMRLSITPIDGYAKNDRYLLYQSIQLLAEPRPPIALFSVPVAQTDQSDLLTLCAICAQVAWPISAPHGEREWIEASEYYRRGGDEVVMISHGFCDTCFSRLQSDDIV